MAASEYDLEQAMERVSMCDKPVPVYVDKKTGKLVVTICKPRITRDVLVGVFDGFGNWQDFVDAVRETERMI